MQVFKICGALIWFALTATACQKNEGSLLEGEITPGSGSAGPAGLGSNTVRVPKPKGPQATDIDLDSKDILGRAEDAPTVYVKHVLIGWADLIAAYRGKMDPRASKRDNAVAAQLARETLDKLKSAADIDPIIKDLSEDPGMKTGNPYKVTAKSQFVPEFKKLALRLKEKEAGIVKSNYGYHVMVRVATPPPDALESADILARPKKAEFSEIQHILIGWKDSAAARDPRAKARSKEDADKLVKEVLAKVKAGEDLVKLMKEYSEDPASKDSGRVFTLTEDEQMVEQFINLALRLEVGEVGVVKSEFGFHIMKRLKPDPIQSLDVLARPAGADKAKIKYILLGWEAAHIDDERGKKRTRAELDKLVAETLAKAKGGKKFEDLMVELSEDKQSGPTGMAIESAMPGLPSMLKMLGTRLKIDEVGVAKTQFGVFIVKHIDEAAPVEKPTGMGSGSAAKPVTGSGSAAKPATGSGSAAKAPAAGSAAKAPAGSGSAK